MITSKTKTVQQNYILTIESYIFVSMKLIWKKIAPPLNIIMDRVNEKLLNKYINKTFISILKYL